MKINPDCVRDVLLALEECITYENAPAGRMAIGGNLVTVHNCPRIKGKYYNQDIFYSVLQLCESGYIDARLTKNYNKGVIDVDKILFITPKGHDFIANIQNEETWKTKISPILKAVGSVSLNVIETIVKGVTDSLIHPI